MEKRNNPSSSNKHDTDTSKKYKFYRKPSIKKKGPEVKQTKTSLARLLKANPLLKVNDKYEPQITTEIKSKPNCTEVSKISMNNISGNGPILKSRINRFDRGRCSSSDFANPILSSTLIGADAVFTEDSPKAPPKYLSKICSSKEEKLNTNKFHRKKSLSSQYLNKKKKEFQEMTKKETVCNNLARNPAKYLRRSVSVDSLKRKVCSRIEEEDNMAEVKSMEDLSQHKVPDEIIRSTVLTSIALEDLKNNTGNPLAKQISGPSNGEDYDDENKENIEVLYIESDSYEDLKIPTCSKIITN